MSLEENKALVRRFYEEVWNRGNVDVAKEVFADDYVRHDVRPTEAQPGAAPEMLKVALSKRTASGDIVYPRRVVKITDTADPATAIAGGDIVIHSQ